VATSAVAAAAVVHQGMPAKCSAYGSLNHIMLSCTASDKALLRLSLAKRKMIVQMYRTPGGNALLSDVSHDDSHVPASLDMPTMEECTCEDDDIEVSVSFNYGAFSSSLTPDRDLSQLWVVDSAWSNHLRAFHRDFVTLEPSSGSSRVSGAGVDVKGSGTIQIVVPLCLARLSAAQ
jgi:hypothetical protein